MINASAAPQSSESAARPSALRGGAAPHGLGVALIPPLLIEAEIARGELVVACAQPLRGERAYYLISPAQEPPAVLASFAAWLQECAATSADERRSR